MQSDKAHVYLKKLEQKKIDIKNADDKNIKAVYKKSKLMMVHTPSIENKAESEAKTPNRVGSLKNFVYDQTESEKNLAYRRNTNGSLIIDDKAEFDRKIAKYNYIGHRSSLATTVEEDEQIKEPNKTMDSGKKK